MWSYAVVNEDLINPRYMAYILEEEGTIRGFSRTNRDSLDRIKSININVPPIDIQNKKMKEVKVLEEKIKNLKEEQVDVNYEINRIINILI